MLDYREAAQSERDALDALSTGVITFDAELRVLFANSAARTRCEELSLRIHAGREMSGPPAVVNSVRALVADAVRNGTGGTSRLPQPNGSETSITVTPVRGRAFDHPSHHKTACPAAIAFLVDISRSREAASALLAGPPRADAGRIAGGNRAHPDQRHAGDCGHAWHQLQHAQIPHQADIREDRNPRPR